MITDQAEVPTGETTEYQMPKQHQRVYGLATLVVAALVHEEFIQWDPTVSSKQGDLEAAIRIVAAALSSLNEPLHSGELDLPPLPFKW